jgi:hypothetical protein
MCLTPSLREQREFLRVLHSYADQPVPWGRTCLKAGFIASNYTWIASLVGPEETWRAAAAKWEAYSAAWQKSRRLAQKSQRTRASHGAFVAVRLPSDKACAYHWREAWCLPSSVSSADEVKHAYAQQRHVDPASLDAIDRQCLSHCRDESAQRDREHELARFRREALAGLRLTQNEEERLSKRIRVGRLASKELVRRRVLQVASPRKAGADLLAGSELGADAYYGRMRSLIL